MNPIDLLSQRMVSSRSVFARSQRPTPDSIKKAEISEVYTFAGYGSGRSCRVKKNNGEILEAILETNGAIKEGQEICVYKSGSNLYVRSMNQSTTESTLQEQKTKEFKIKILYTRTTADGVELYLGGDRIKPKKIHTFPVGSLVNGLCHNGGRGDKYSIGVSVLRQSDSAIYNWNSIGERSESKTSEWKTRRTQPIGHGFFAEPWLPKIAEKKWLFILKSKEDQTQSLCFFGNNSIKIVVDQIPQTSGISAFVVRRSQGLYTIAVTVKTGENSETKYYEKEAIESGSIPQNADWIFEAIDHLIDKNGDSFLDQNLKGQANVTPQKTEKKLTLDLWDCADGLFRKSSTAKLEELSSVRDSGTRELMKVSIGQTSGTISTKLDIKLKLSSGLAPTFPDGSPLPPPGPDPARPYYGYRFSFGWSGGTFDGLWTAFPNQGNFSINPTNIRSIATGEPMWAFSGICVGIKYDYGWNTDEGPNAWPTLQEYLSLSPAFRKVTRDPQYMSYWENVDGSRVLVPSTTGKPPDHGQSWIVLSESGDISELWDFRDEGYWSSAPFDHKKIVYNWGPGDPPMPPPDPKKQPPGSQNPSAPTENPWTLEDYEWRDPIVVGKSQELLKKTLLFVNWTGNPLKRPQQKRNDWSMQLATSDEPDIKIGGDLPLLCSEDLLIGTTLYRVDRSPFYPRDLSKTHPAKSSVKKLVVETYSLSESSIMTAKLFDITQIPDDAEILSASFHP